VSPNPVTAAAAWTFTLAVDVVAVAIAALFLGWDRWCPAGTAGCPSAADRAGRDALALAVLGAVLLFVALLALLRGRFLLVVGQLAVAAAVAYLASQAVPAAFDHLRAQVHAGTATREFEFRL
jgi:hypothetical protein